MINLYYGTPLEKTIFIIDKYFLVKTTVCIGINVQNIDHRLYRLLGSLFIVMIELFTAYE